MQHNCAAGAVKLARHALVILTLREPQAESDAVLSTSARQVGQYILSVQERCEEFRLSHTYFIDLWSFWSFGKLCKL